MDLERVAAVIRPRSQWAAIDLGFTMVRSWWRPVMVTWLVTVLPIWILVSVLFGAWTGWSIFLLWWLRPLFDRVPLHVVSRTLFGATPTVGETLRAVPKLWWGHLLSALTVFRLDPARSFNLPVWQLEGLRVQERWERSTLLQRDAWPVAVTLSAACRLMEAVLFVGLLGLVNFFIPNSNITSLFDLILLIFQSEAPAWLGVACRVLGFVAVSIIEPFYVAAGFSLYLNRRTRLEGWDVELAFKRLARRLARGRRVAPGAVRMAASLALVLMAAPAKVPASAQETSAQETAESWTDPQEAVREVLAEPEFKTREMRSHWELREELVPSLREKAERPDGDVAVRGLDALGYLASGVEMILVVVVAAVLLAVLVAGLRRLGWSRGGSRAKDDGLAPVTIRGPDGRHRPRDLGDVTAEARRLWQEGRLTDALELLYRGALGVLGRRDDVDAEPSFTEEDWIRLTRGLHQRGRVSREQNDFFARLVRAWQAAAYGHRPPARDAVGELCDAWKQFATEAK